MNFSRSKPITLFTIALLITAILIGCSNLNEDEASNNNAGEIEEPIAEENNDSSNKENNKATENENNKDESTSTINAYADVRKLSFSRSTDLLVANMDLSDKGNIIKTLWFNEKTVWPEASKMPEDVVPEELLEAAKNPGLGVRDIHKQGITGKGVNVAIIDQPMYLDHPEFEGKIIEYKDFECNSDSSMHGPAVASLLVGEHIGTAPGAKVYYAAAPSWKQDAEYYARALDWIIEENSKLPEGEKIRVVSVSAAPSGQGSPFNKNNEMWDKSVAQAEQEGILVLDCTSHHGRISPSYHTSFDDIEEADKYKPGFPGIGSTNPSVSRLHVPTSPRTTAEEYKKGDFGYQYTGRGGLSWAIPYASGVLALGWELRPEISGEEMFQILLDSAYVKNHAKYINPSEFIKQVQNYKGK